MIYLKNTIYSIFYYLISALGISLTIKAEIGVSSFNSLNVALADSLCIKIGTITMAVNFCFLLLCWLIDEEKKIRPYIIMIITLISFGTVINFFFYNILHFFIINSYSAKLFAFILGTIIAGFGTGKVLKYGLLKFPIETFCLLLTQKTKKSFKFYRYGVDLICICLSLILSFSFQLPIYIREGTIISFFLLTSVIHWSKNS